MAKTTNETTAKTTKSTGTAQEASDEIKLDRRGVAERRAGDAPSGGKPADDERRKAPRRRQIDPTTCERDYSDVEIEFMQAMDDYKRANGRMFPTCSEILEVLQGLGYQKVTPGSELGDLEEDLADRDAVTADADADSLDDEEALVTLGDAGLTMEQPPANVEV